MSSGNVLAIELAAALANGPVIVDERAAVVEAGSFLFDEIGVVVGEPPVAAFHQCSIDPGAYDENLWVQLAVDRPAGLDKAVRKRLAELLAGRHCAGRGLKAIGLRDTRVERGDGGSPVWPAGVCGSISHHDSKVVAVVTTAPGVLGVGIDVQSIVPAATIHEIRSTILRDGDIALMAAFGEKEAGLIFTLIFSIKESFFKAAFPTVRRYFDFQAAEILELDLRGGRFLLRLCEDLGDDRLVAGMTFPGHFRVQGQYVVSLLVFERRGN